MSQSEKSFTVSDRRHLTAEGRPRGDEAGADEQQSPQATPTASGSPPAAPQPPAELSHFLLGLAAEAGRLLAEEGVPEGTPRPQVLAAAREIVAILEMLKDKTEARRTAEENALLAQLLFELRMAYVEKTRAGQP